MNKMQEDKITVDSMSFDDIEDILQKYSDQGWNKPRDIIEGYFEKQKNDDLSVFVAKYNDDLAGYTVLFKDTGVGPFANKGIPVINDLIVFEKFQCKGIGCHILDAAEQKASELNNCVQLAVGLHSGYGAAQRIYVKRGYVPDGSGVWYKDSPLDPYDDCQNDDELVLYLIKNLS